MVKQIIQLPNDIPAEFLQTPQSEEDADNVKRRRERLFRYFGYSPTNQDDAYALIDTLARIIFPAFRKKTISQPREPGRPLADKPKHSPVFLAIMAEAYDEMRSKITYNAAPSRLYNLFLKEEHEFAEALKTGGKSLSVNTFKKLLNVGRTAKTNKVIWYSYRTLPPNCRIIHGRYIVVNDKLGSIYEGIRTARPLITKVISEQILTIDPADPRGRERADSWHWAAREALLLRTGELQSKLDGLPPEEVDDEAIQALNETVLALIGLMKSGPFNS